MSLKKIGFFVNIVDFFQGEYNLREIYFSIKFPLKNVYLNIYPQKIILIKKDSKKMPLEKIGLFFENIVDFFQDEYNCTYNILKTYLFNMIK